MRLLIVGASGFLGKNFLMRHGDSYEITALYRRDDFPDFLKRYQLNSVRMIRCELTDTDQVSQALDCAGRKWDLCLYLASRVDIPLSVEDPRTDLFDNVIGLLNLLLNIECERLVYLSSGAVYDGSKGQVGLNTLIAPSLPYAISKLTAEHYIKYYRERRKNISGYIILRFFGAYGPYEAPHKIYTRLARTFGIENQDEFSIYGDGTNLIDAMYIDDAIDALHLVLQAKNNDKIFDLCCGHPMTIENLVYTAAEILQRNSIRLIKSGTAQECIRFFASPVEFQNAFGIVPKIPLNQGLPQLVDHLRRTI